jgi:hypothetical protein
MSATEPDSGFVLLEAGEDGVPPLVPSALLASHWVLVPDGAAAHAPAQLAAPAPAPAPARRAADPSVAAGPVPVQAPASSLATLPARRMVPLEPQAAARQSAQPQVSWATYMDNIYAANIAPAPRYPPAPVPAPAPVPRYPPAPASAAPPWSSSFAPEHSAWPAQAKYAAATPPQYHPPQANVYRAAPSRTHQLQPLPAPARPTPRRVPATPPTAPPVARHVDQCTHAHIPTQDLALTHVYMYDTHTLSLCVCVCVCGGGGVGTVPAVMEHGLMNEAGENNCFLNGVLQILWHTRAFRTAVQAVEHRGCSSDACVYCQLRVSGVGGTSLSLSLFLP